MEAAEAVEANVVENVAEVKKSLKTPIHLHPIHFLRPKRQSRSLESLRLSWLIRSLRPVRSSGSHRYSNSYSR